MEEPLDFFLHVWLGSHCRDMSLGNHTFNYSTFLACSFTVIFDLETTATLKIFKNKLFYTAGRLLSPPSVSFTERGELRGIRSGLKRRLWGAGRARLFFKDMDTYNYNVIKMTLLQNCPGLAEQTSCPVSVRAHSDKAMSRRRGVFASVSLFLASVFIKSICNFSVEDTDFLFTC